EEVGHVAHDPADLLGVVVDRVAADRGLAPGGVEQGGQDAHGGGLAGAVGADEAVDVALLQLEAEPVEGVQLAVHLGQLAGLDHERWSVALLASLVALSPAAPGGRRAGTSPG